MNLNLPKDIEIEVVVKDIASGLPVVRKTSYGWESAEEALGKLERLWKREMQIDDWQGEHDCKGEKCKACAEVIGYGD